MSRLLELIQPIINSARELKCSKGGRCSTRPVSRSSRLADVWVLASDRTLWIVGPNFPLGPLSAAHRTVLVPGWVCWQMRNETANATNTVLRSIAATKHFLLFIIISFINAVFIKCLFLAFLLFQVLSPRHRRADALIRYRVVIHSSFQLISNRRLENPTNYLPWRAFLRVHLWARTASIARGWNILSDFPNGGYYWI